MLHLEQHSHFNAHTILANRCGVSKSSITSVLGHPRAPVKASLPFESEGLKLIQIHAVHVENKTYDFAIGIGVVRR